MDHESNLILSDGALKCATVILRDGRHLVGEDDYLQIGLDYNQDAKDFRAALTERAQEASYIELERSFGKEIADGYKRMLGRSLLNE